MVTWGEVYISIKPYYSETSWWNAWWTGTEWLPLTLDTEMVDGRLFQIVVSQDCTLDWNDHHYEFTEGGNTFTWGAEVNGDIVTVIPLTLLIPSIPEPPLPDNGLWPSISSWITEYWWVIAVGIVVLVIGTYAYVRYK